MISERWSRSRLYAKAVKGEVGINARRRDERGMTAPFFLFFSLLSHSAARRTRDIRFEPESGQADATIVREYRKADPGRREKFHTVLSNFDHSARKVLLLCQRTLISCCLFLFLG